MNISIKTKLLLIALLFFVSLSGTELISSYVNREITKSNDEMSLRQSQVILLKDFKIAFADLTLTAMDVIIDRDAGMIDPDLEKKLHIQHRLLKEILPLFVELADTDQEVELSKDISSLYVKLEKIIFTELFMLINSKAAKPEFERVDQAIDESTEKIAENVELFVTAINEEYRETNTHMKESISRASLIRRVFVGVMLVIAGGALYMLGRGIIVPVLSARDMIRDIAEGDGDLTQRLPAGSSEIGELSAWFNVFTEKLHTMVSQIQSNLSTLNTSTDSFASLSKRLNSDSIEAYSRSASVEKATEGLSSNMTNIATSSSKVADNMNMVASAAEEMDATVKGIADNTEQARQVTEQAVVKTNATTSRMDTLGGAAQEISKVTESITEISEQTNLLALNATIEAARAGEAGKGFAVVANEIKELAKQTAEATLEIREKINAIQSSTDVTISEMSDINTVINEVNDIVSTITTSVNEQSNATKEIVTQVTQAAQGINSVSENVSDSSIVSEGIAEEVGGVSLIADSLKKDGDAVGGQVNDLIELSNQLDKIIGQFKL